jgi:hypothetical protein
MPVHAEEPIGRGNRRRPRNLRTHHALEFDRAHASGQFPAAIVIGQLLPDCATR